MEKETIIGILRDWNFWGSKIDIGIERPDYLSVIQNSLKTKEVIVLSGIRRCGKSTLLLQILRKFQEKNSLIINLEDPRWVGITLQDLMKIYDAYLEYLNPDKNHAVVLDEIQNIEKWESFARYLSENKKISVFVTGSNSKFLSGEFSSALSGRYIEYHIFPLSFREFLLFKGFELKSRLDHIKHEKEIKRLFSEHLTFGGMPKIALTDDKNEKRKILTSYYDTIIIKDIALRYGIRDTRQLGELAKFYLTNIANVISINKIRRNLGLNLRTVQRFSTYLEYSCLLNFIPKFSYSLNTQMISPKKIYCHDVGLRNNASFRFSDDEGRLLENLVFIELKRIGEEIYYYRTSNDLEVDFAVKKGKRIAQLIQVTKSLENFQSQERELKSLHKALDETNLKEGLILTHDEERTIHQNNHTIIVKPVWKWLLDIK